MIGVKGLVVPILRAVLNQYLAVGLLKGLAIFALAIIILGVVGLNYDENLIRLPAI